MTTPIYLMEEWAEAQANPHITVNTMMRILEAMSSRRLLDLSSNDPPSPAEDGGVYFINGSGTGEWAGHSNELAIAIAGGWHFIPPQEGWLFYSVQDGYMVQWQAASPAAWVTFMA